ncbi:2-hydroxychromene-2-carboxylate isomerase [Streptomyces sp. V2I9]|nr:2-hydroxychromene-2-carboxylate isomerase [Streptomyces sp. V2I9]
MTLPGPDHGCWEAPHLAHPTADALRPRARGVAEVFPMDRDGVFGAPFFVHRREKFRGVDR